MVKTKLANTQKVMATAKNFAQKMGQNKVVAPKSSELKGMNPPIPTNTTKGKLISMSPPMLAAIKNSRKGQIPPGLAKWIAARKAGK